MLAPAQLSFQGSLPLMAAPQMVVTRYTQTNTQIVLLETISELSGSAGYLSTTAKEINYYFFPRFHHIL
jgi:hypothetical protein